MICTAPAMESLNAAYHRLAARIEIGHNYEVEIKFRISVEQYMPPAA